MTMTRNTGGAALDLIPIPQGTTRGVETLADGLVTPATPNALLPPTIAPRKFALASVTRSACGAFEGARPLSPWVVTMWAVVGTTPVVPLWPSAMAENVGTQNPTLRGFVERPPSFLAKFTPTPKTPAHRPRTAQARVGSRQKSAGFAVRVGAVPVSLVIAPSVLRTPKMSAVTLDRPTPVRHKA